MGRDPVRLAAADRLLGKWASTAPGAGIEAGEAVAEMAAIRRAIAACDMTALAAYGDINGALRRMGVLDAAVTGTPSITSGRIWRSQRVPG